MGNSEEGKSSKSDKSSSPGPPDQSNNTHVYPDWAAMQAYYGPRVALPPYYNSAVASGHPHHPYVWGPPQPMMPPYGSPYAAVYSPGGVYQHAPVPIGSHPYGHGIPASPVTVAPSSIETPTKSSGSKDKGLIKKLKGGDELAISIGNDNGNGATTDVEGRMLSQSVETESSSDGSDENTTRGRKRSRDGTLPNGGDVKIQKQVDSIPATNASSNKILGTTTASGSGAGQLVGHVSPTMTSLELGYPLNANTAKASSASVQQTSAMLSETWNERELKRERRKQSNRESARRSRLRKQAEIEELARKVESLTAENAALKSEISQVSEKAEKLRLENAALMEKLNGGRTEHNQGSNVNTEDLLARVKNSVGEDEDEDEGNLYETNSNSVAKLHQLLDANPKTDAVATS